MKRVKLLLVLLTLVVSCSNEEDSILLQLKDELNFTIQKLNSDNNYISKPSKVVVAQKMSSWVQSPNDKIHLVREAYYNVTLENGEQIMLGLYFSKANVERNLLHIDDTKKGHYWSYKSLDKEINNFYKGCAIRILINNTNAYFVEHQNKRAKVISVTATQVLGKNKNVLNLEFSGKATGFYDPNGTEQEFYLLTNGTFKGIIE